MATFCRCVEACTSGRAPIRALPVGVELDAVKWAEVAGGVEQLLRAPLLRAEGDPRDPAARSRPLVTYRAWVNPGLTGVGVAGWHRGWCGGAARALLRLRAGALDLQVTRGRWVGTPWQARTCERCASGAVEDAYHVVFECGAYARVRQRHSGLFSEFEGALSGAYEVGALASFLAQDPGSLSRFVWQLVGARERAPTGQSVLAFDSLSSSDSDQVEVVLDTLSSSDSDSSVDLGEGDALPGLDMFESDSE